VKVAEAGAYSNLQLNRSLQEAQLSRQDAALATELVYGTIQHQRTLDYRLAGLVAKGLDKLAPWVHQLLRMSTYQLLYLDRVPAHAAVNEAVQIAKKRGHAGISGMVNGVLRNMERRLDEMKQPIQEADPVKRIGIAHSYPDWLVKRWIELYGEQTAEAICATGNEPPHSSLRINRLRISREKALASMVESGYEAAESPLTSSGVIVSGGGNLAQTDGYSAGLWSLQDESSMLVAEVCAPQPGMTVLDCCAAPGGKSAHLAEIMEDRGRIVANDLHEHKRALIEEQAKRLGLASVQAVTGDAAELASRYPQQSFDLVLLDAPCTGFGVIRRKPEIKWTKTPDDVHAIAELQARLLAEAAKLVKPGGTLVYSTCTIEREENEEQIKVFLQKQPSFHLDPAWPQHILAPLRESGVIGDTFAGFAQLLPQHFGSDGFFIARLTRIG
jgi:16S rRNA (cytosine967-C5)-methyltransferase